METAVHDAAPIVLALTYPGTFYSICLALFVIAALLWWLLPSLQKRPSAQKGLRTELSLFYTGSVVAFGIIGTMIQFQSNIQRDQQQQRLALSSENAKRFDGAVKQIQKQSDISALGGIYTLGELTKQDGFYWPAVALLNAYLRHAAQAPGGDVNRAEIANSLHVLSERNWEYRKGEPFPLDFSSLNLKGLRFSELKLWGSNFRNSNLSDVFLPGAKMEGTDFYCVNFEGANFQKSYLHKPTGPAELGPKLNSTNFRNAMLNEVAFKQNEYSFVDVEGTCFEGANLTGADIRGFDLSKAAGLTRDQILSSKEHPEVSGDFRSQSCRPFRDLCVYSATAP